MANLRPKVVIDSVRYKGGSGYSANGVSEGIICKYITDALRTRFRNNSFTAGVVDPAIKTKSDDIDAIKKYLKNKGWKKSECIYIKIHASYSRSSSVGGAIYLSNSGDSAGKQIGELSRINYYNAMKKYNSKASNSKNSSSNRNLNILKGWKAAFKFCPGNISNVTDANFMSGKVVNAPTGYLGHANIVANSILEAVAVYAKVTTNTKGNTTGLLDDETGAAATDAMLNGTMLNMAQAAVGLDTASGDASAWIGTKFGEDYDYDSVSFSELLHASYDEKKYGPNIAQISQPLVKFTNKNAYYDMDSEDNADATEVLKQYAKYYLEANNARVDVCNVQLIGCPWLRPGFNVWLDPLYEDKIYYIDSITHSGNPVSGVYTNLSLSYGRRRSDFLKTGKNRKLGSIGNDDNIFTKDKYYKSAKDFGTVLENEADFNKMTKLLKEAYEAMDNMGVVNAENTPQAALYEKVGSSKSLRNPTVNVVNEVGQVIFEKDEWEEITGRSDYDDVLEKQKGKESIVQSTTDEGGTSTTTDTTTTSNTTTSNTTTTSKTVSESQDAGDTTMSWKSGRFVCDNSLSKGKSGSTVKKLQSILNKFIDDGTIKGDKLTVDGKFGAKTEKLLIAYQKAKDLKADGVCGPKTTAAINKDLGFSEKSSLSEGTNIETGEAKGRLTDKMFVGQYTLDEIQSKLTSLYSKAPEVVTRRRNVIKKGCKALRESMDLYYVNNDWNK